MRNGMLLGGMLSIALTLILVPVSSVRSAEPTALAAPAGEWIKTELYFGRDIPGGHEVSRGEWIEFMDKVITPQFPAGLTVLESYGQMQHAAGPIEKQSTWVVLMVHPKDTASDKAIRAVISAYRQQFHNPQVMCLSLPVTARFFAD